MWKNLRYFKADSKLDAWGDASKMNPETLKYLDEFRHEVGAPIIVTSGYRKGDPAQHGLGRAVDIVAPKFDGALFDLYLLAERFGFTGIGIYKHWMYDGKRIGGLHLDTRVLLGSQALKAARWACVRPGADKLTNTAEILKLKQVYLPLDLKTMREEGFL